MSINPFNNSNARTEEEENTKAIPYILLKLCETLKMEKII
jgi:hypothetical protein